MKISNILSEAMFFYKKNFKHLIGFSLIVVLFIGGFATKFRILETFPVDESTPATIIIHGFLLLLWITLLIIFAPRFYLAIVIVLNCLFDGEKITLRKAYKLTKDKYWKMLGCFIVIIIVANSSAYLFQSWNIEFPFDFSIHILFGAFIWSLYYLICPVVALEPKSKGKLKRAREMIKGNYGAVLLLYLMTTALLNMIYRFTFLIVENNVLGILIRALIHYTAFFFVFPFAQTVIVVVYRTLIESEVLELNANLDCSVG